MVLKLCTALEMQYLNIHQSEEYCDGGRVDGTRQTILTRQMLDRQRISISYILIIPHVVLLHSPACKSKLTFDQNTHRTV